jgi:hypothetical protein
MRLLGGIGTRSKRLMKIQIDLAGGRDEETKKKKEGEEEKKR